jgi:protein-arginine deiminase
VVLAGCGGDTAPVGDALPADAAGADGLGDRGFDTAPPPIAPIVDLRGDINRDGVVDLTDSGDDDGEETWDAQHGAIFLANLDDDADRCPDPTYYDSDDELAACHDAADDAVNGAADAADLAPLKVAPWPAAPQDAVGELVVALPVAAAGTDPATLVRLFARDGAGYRALGAKAQLSAAELRAGATLALEGRDIVRDRARWDGTVDVTLTVRYAEAGAPRMASDTVRLRVAPLLTSHHLQPIEKLYVSQAIDAESKSFRDEMFTAVQEATGPVGEELFTDDQWAQDLFETAWMAMPAAQSAQQRIAVLLRTPGLEEPGHPAAPLRYSSRVVFALRGPDVAVVQQYDRQHPLEQCTLDSFGNLETIPPYAHQGEHYPLGRMIMGSATGFAPDASLIKLLEGQRLQPPLWLDTSWLLVGHVDETICFVRAATPRGWMLVLNDPELARSMLQQAAAAGNGSAKLFAAKKWLSGWDTEVSAEKTIDEVLADTEVMAQTAKAAVEVKAQLAALQQATGLTEAEIIHAPFLHYALDGASAAYQPGTANGAVLGDGHYAAPRPHGPLIGGEDLFERQLTDAFAAHGIKVHFVENWDLFHRLGGEVHCGSNARRVLPADIKWWETGR